MAAADNLQLNIKLEDATDAVSSRVESTPSSGGSKNDSMSSERTQDMLSDFDSGYNSSSLVLPVHDSASVPRYKMDHTKQGRVLVICNSRFKPNLKLTDRNGCDKDVEALKATFDEEMRLDWTCRENQTALEMYEAVKNECKKDHWDYNCFIVAFLTHGVLGEVYGTDASIKIEKLVEPLKMCPSLIGKPKIVIIQACRGKNVDHGVKVSHDGPGSGSDATLTLPIEADFLYAYSTADGYVAFNNPRNGSWFIQALCAEFKQSYKTLEIMQMLTRVCHKIAHEHASYTPSRPETHELKQVSSVTTTLTKALYFKSYEGQ